MKVVYNACYGGFHLSSKAVQWLNAGDCAVDELGIFQDHTDIDRHDQLLVQCVEIFGKEASERFSNLKVRVIEGNRYRIVEYDGWECVETPKSITWIKV